MIGDSNMVLHASQRSGDIFNAPSSLHFSRFIGGHKLLDLPFLWVRWTWVYFGGVSHIPIYLYGHGA